MKKEKPATDINLSTSYISIESMPIVSLYRRNRLEGIDEYCEYDPEYDTHARKLRIEVISEREDSEYEGKKSPYKVPMSGDIVRHDGVR